MAFSANARIPIRPLSMDNKSIAMIKELLVDYKEHQLYICDENGEFFNITASVGDVIPQIIEMIQNDPDIIKGVKIEVINEDGTTKEYTIEEGIVTALQEIEKLKKLITGAVPEPSDSNPLSPSSSPSPGTSEKYSREDHVHPLQETVSKDSAGQQINTTYIKDLSTNGTTIVYTKGNNSTGTITIPTMKGATESMPGTAGVVPPPIERQRNSFLRGDGTWTEVNDITGNANTSSTWQTARNINGMTIDGSANRFNYGTCSTIASTATKVVSCTGFTLTTGSEITVKFINGNAANDLMLNVNDTGAKPIYYREKAFSSDFYIAKNATYTFRYNGTQYDLVGDLSRTPTIDTALSATSTNPVQNKAVTEAITDIRNVTGNAFAVCTTNAEIAAKTATSSQNYSLRDFGIVCVRFNNAVPADATLNVNSTGAKQIKFKNANIVDGVIETGDTVAFAYDGTSYNIISIVHSHAFFTVELSTTWDDTNGASPYTQVVTVPGIRNTDHPFIDLSPSSDDYDTIINEYLEYGYIYRVETLNGSIKVYTSKPIEIPLTLRIKNDK